MRFSHPCHPSNGKRMNFHLESDIPEQNRRTVMPVIKQDFSLLNEQHLKTKVGFEITF